MAADEIHGLLQRRGVVARSANVHRAGALRPFRSAGDLRRRDAAARRKPPRSIGAQRAGEGNSPPGATKPCVCKLLK